MRPGSQEPALADGLLLLGMAYGTRATRGLTPVLFPPQAPPLWARGL